MAQNFKTTDVYRQRIEKEAFAEKRAKERVTRAVENAFTEQLLKNYGNGKLVQASEAELSRIEAGTSSAHAFDGKVTVFADVTDSAGLKRFSAAISVKNSEFELLDADELKKLIDEAEVKAQAQAEVFEVDVQAKAKALKANLGDFRIVNDGSDYLKVYHSALDIGKELGVFHKDEYEKLANKEASFKEILQNQVSHSMIENNHELVFEGSFAEPEIEGKPEENIVTSADYKTCINCDKQLDDCTCDPSQTKDDPEKHSVEAEEDENSAIITEAVDEIADEKEAEEVEENLLARQPDTYQRSIDSENQSKANQRGRLLRRIANDLYKHLFNLKYAGVKIGSVDPSDLNDKDSGSVKIKAFLTDQKGSKNVVISVDVESGSYKLPKADKIAEVLETVDTIESAVDQTLQKDVEERIKEIDEHDNWEEKETEAALKDAKQLKKEAAHSDGIQMLGPTSVIKLDKHLLGLPDDTEIGTVVYADGHHWKLTDKSDGQLSKEADSGSIWTFTKVETGDKKPEYELNV